MRARRPCLGLLIALSLIIVSQAGCSFLAATHQEVSITANDPRALIYVDGKEVGRGSAKPLLSRDEAHSVKVTLDDRKNFAYIGRKISALGIVDIIGGVLFGIHFIGYFAPGFWELEPTDITVKVPSARR